MILEDGDTGHAKVDVLAGSPFHLSWDSNFDRILGHNCYCGLVANQPGHPERVRPIKIEEPHEVGRQPYAKSRKEVVPRGEVVVAVPEHHPKEYYGDWDVERDKEFVHAVAEGLERVNTQETKRD